jgi:hypothetical protein
MTKSERILIPVIIAASVLLGCAILTTGENWGGDFSAYLAQAASLLDGRIQTYIEHNTFTIFQSSYAIGPVIYPWGFPLMLIPVLGLFGTNLIALKIVSIACFALFLVCTHLLFRERLTPGAAILLVALLAANPELIAFHDHLLSDIPFLVFATLSILLIDRWVAPGRTPALSFRRGALLGSVIFYAWFIRPNGILLLATLFVCQVVRAASSRSRQRKGPFAAAAGSLSPYLVFLALCGLSLLIFPGGKSPHASILRQVTPVSVIGNLAYYFRLPQAFFRGAPRPDLLYFFTLPFVFTGIWVYFRRTLHYFVYCFLHLLLCVVWPGKGQYIRLIFPILPFYLFYAFAGMEWTAGRVRRWRPVASLYAIFWGIILVFFLLSSVTSAIRNLQNQRIIGGPFYRTSLEMFHFISNHTETDSVIVFFKPRVMRMMADRNAIMIRDFDDLGKGDYYAYSKEMKGYDQVMLETVFDPGVCLGFELRFENERFTVYRIVKVKKTHSRLPALEQGLARPG